MISALILLCVVLAGWLIIASRDDTPTDRGSPQPPSIPSVPSGETTPQQTLRWSYDMRDEVLAPALVVDDAVVLATHHGEVIALSLDGHRRWEGTLSNGPGYGFGFDPLAASDGLVFATGQDTGLHAFDVASGRLAWRYKGLGENTTGAQIAQGRLFVAGSRGVTALDPRTGRQQWIIRLANLTPTVPALAGNTVIAQAQGVLIGLDARTGRQRWSLPDGGSSVVVKGNVLYRTTTSHRRDREVFAFSLSSGQELWTTPSKGLAFGTPLPDGDHLYTNDGLRLYCFEADTGRMLWRRRVSATPAVTRSLILHAGLIYVTNDRGVLALTAGDGVTKWRYEAGVEPYSLAINDDIAYLDVGSHLRAIDLPAK